MNRSMRILAVCVGTIVMMMVVATRARASDRTGIYATITAVDYEPEGDWKAAERVRVRGVFSLATGQRQYEKPVQGYLYCSLVEGKETACRREWRDLGKLAGSGKIVALGSRFQLQKTKVRALEAKPEKPTPFSLSFSGIREVRRDSAYFVIRDLNTFARPLAPLAGKDVAPGKVQLEAAKMHGGKHAESKYVFWIAGPDGKKHASPPVSPGEKKVVWKSSIQVRAGVSYSWGVRAVDGEWKGPEAKAAFRGKGSPSEKREKATSPEKGSKAAEGSRA